MPGGEEEELQPGNKRKNNIDSGSGTKNDSEKGNPKSDGDEGEKHDGVSFDGKIKDPLAVTGSNIVNAVTDSQPELKPEQVQEPKLEPEQVQEPKLEPEQVQEPEPEPEQVQEPEPEPEQVQEPEPEPEQVQEPEPEPEQVQEPEPEEEHPQPLAPVPAAHDAAHDANHDAAHDANHDDDDDDDQPPPNPLPPNVIAGNSTIQGLNAATPQEARRKVLKHYLVDPKINERNNELAQLSQGGQPVPQGGQPAPQGGQPAPQGGQPAPQGGQPNQGGQFDPLARETGIHSKDVLQGGINLGDVALGTSTFTSVVQNGLGYGAKLGSFFSEDDTQKSCDKFSDDVLSGNASSIAFNSAGLLNNSMSTVSSGMIAGAGFHQARKSKNKYKRSAGRLNGASGVLGGLTGLFNLTSNAAGITGASADIDANDTSDAKEKEKFKDRKQTAGYVGGFADIASSLTSLSGALVGYNASLSDVRRHTGTSEGLDKYINKYNLQAPAANAANQQAPAAAPPQGNVSLQAKYLAKARKHSLFQAKNMHDARKDESRAKGFLEAIGTSISSFGTFTNGLSKVVSAMTGGKAGLALDIMNAVGNLSSLTGLIMNASGRGYTRNKAEQEKKAFERHQENYIDQYFLDKSAKIQQEASQMQITLDEHNKLGPNVRTLSDDEKKILLVMRLGVNVPNSATSLPLNAKKDALKLLTKKRAEYIFYADNTNGEKDEMLDSLGLDHDASLKDIWDALSGD